MSVAGSLAYVAVRRGSMLAARRALSGFGRTTGVQEVRKGGVSVIPNYLPRDRCDELRFEVDRILREFSCTVWQDREGSDLRAFGADRVSELVRDFARDGTFAAFSRGLMGGAVGPTDFTLANRVVAIEGAAGSGGGWHRDSLFDRQPKAILYLNDVDEKCGPFEYFPKSHHLRCYFRLIRGGFPPEQLRFDESDGTRIAMMWTQPQAVCGSAGTLVLVDTSVIHRGRPPESGERYALTNYLYPKRGSRKERWLEEFGSLFVDRDHASMQ